MAFFKYQEIKTIQNKIKHIKNFICQGQTFLSVAGYIAVRYSKLAHFLSSYLDQKTVN